MDFYRQLETIEDPKDHLPSTAMPDTEDITGLFEKAIADGYDAIIVFSLSSGLGRDEQGSAGDHGTIAGRERGE